MGMGVSILLIAAGAILRWAVNVTTSGVDLHTVGIILFIIGIIGLIVSILFWGSWGGLGGDRMYRRQRRISRDGAGGYTEEERGNY